MTLILKKLLNSIIVCALFVSLLVSTPVYAAEEKYSPINNEDIVSSFEKDYPLLLWNLKETPQAYGLSSDDFNVVKLLSPVRFITSNLSDESLANKEDLYVLHFPMVNNSEKIFAIYTIIKTDSGVNGTMGVDFAPMLEAAKNTGADEVTLVQDDSGILAITNEGESVSQNGNTKSLGRNIMNSINPNIQSNHPYVSLDLEKIDDTYSQKAALEIEGFSVEAVESNSILSKSKETEETTEETTAFDNNNNAMVASASGSSYLSNYPIVDQRVDGTERGLCWAATVASICRFEKSSKYSSLTAKNVADYMNIGYDAGGTNNNAKKALNHYLGSPYVPTNTGVLSDNTIKTVINNNDPAYMRNKRKTGFWPWSYDYHAVALTGYSFTTKGSTIQIMDPAYEQFKTATKSGSKWSFAFGDTSFTWLDTVRLRYK